MVKLPMPVLFCQGDEQELNYIVNVRKNDNIDTENIIIEKSEATTLNKKCFHSNSD
jgi:hypothetical protein